MKPKTYVITEVESGELYKHKQTLEEAAAIMNLNTEDIEWAIEEEGFCSTDQYMVEEEG